MLFLSIFGNFVCSNFSYRLQHNFLEYSQDNINLFYLKVMLPAIANFKHSIPFIKNW